VSKLIVVDSLMRDYLVFTGRPNAGKSSVIKEILGLNLSTGKYPGTTRRISDYPLSQGLFLIDMPGYGKILKASRKMEDNIKDRILDFLDINAERIILAVHVLDISTFVEVTWRLEKKGVRSLDLEMIEFLRDNIGNPPLVAANKIDKAGKQLEEYLSELRNRLFGLDLSSHDEYVFPVSARTGEGIGVFKNELHKRLVNKGHKNPFKYLKNN
jgi:GTP-binding protein EngB required for normal cell division